MLHYAIKASLFLCRLHRFHTMLHILFLRNMRPKLLCFIGNSTSLLVIMTFQVTTSYHILLMYSEYVRRKRVNPLLHGVASEQQFKKLSDFNE